MIHDLLTGVTTNTAGPTINTRRRAVEGVWQVQITGTAATVKIQGRMNANAPWVDIDTLTASGSKIVALFPQMQAVVSGVTAATVNAWLTEPH